MKKFIAGIALGTMLGITTIATNTALDIQAQAPKIVKQALEIASGPIAPIVDKQVRVKLVSMIPTKKKAPAKKVDTYKDMILKITSSVHLKDGRYYDTGIDENGDAWNFYSTDNIYQQWINAKLKNNSAIVDYTIMPPAPAPTMVIQAKVDKIFN